MSSIQLQAFQNIRLQPHIGLLSSILFAGLTGLSAFLVIPLPFTPIPITGQTFLVILSGFALGRKYGPLSQILYLGLGVLGVPWFAEGSHGLSVLLGATGGYLIGFVAASFIVGYVTDLSSSMRRPMVLILLSGVGTLVVYLFGVTGLMLVAQLDLWTSLLVGFFPFVPGDLFKVVLVFLTATVLLPSKDTKADEGIERTSGSILVSILVFVSTITVVSFVAYLLSAGDAPPVNLASLSILSSIVVLPSLVMVSRYGTFISADED